jgi:hypothetical protein
MAAECPPLKNTVLLDYIRTEKIRVLPKSSNASKTNSANMKSSFRLDLKERSEKEEKDGRNESERDTGRERVRVGSEKERVREREREKEREREREKEREREREREKRRSEDISDALTALNMSTSTVHNTHSQHTADIASPNARLTLTMLECLVCGGDVSLASVDCIVAAALSDFREIVDFQDSVREHYISASTKTKKQKKIQNIASSSGKRNDVDSSEHSARTEGPPPLPQDHYDRTDSPKSVRTIIGILVICSRLYKKSGTLKTQKKNLTFFED